MTFWFIDKNKIKIIAIDEGKAETYNIVDAEINIQIKGPNPDEFESIEMDFMNFQIRYPIKLNQMIQFQFLNILLPKAAMEIQALWILI